MKKSISTEMTGENIARVIALLTHTPPALLALSKNFTQETQIQPLKDGERSFIEIVAHILNCDDRTTESIYTALLLKEPLILDIHPERHCFIMNNSSWLSCWPILVFAAQSYSEYYHN